MVSFNEKHIQRQQSKAFVTLLEHKNQLKLKECMFTTEEQKKAYDTINSEFEEMKMEMKVKDDKIKGLEE